MSFLGAALSGGASGGSIGSAVVNLSLNTAQYQAQLAKTQASTQASTGKMGQAFAGMSAGVVTAVAAVGAVSVKMALDFERAFTRIEALSNASAGAIGEWKEEVLDLAGTTAQAPQELAEALFFLSSAGLKTADVMPALEEAAQGAAVGLGETADVANTIASAMNAYASSGLTAANVTDTLVAAIREGRAEPEEFANALGRILPIASRAGVGFDEVTASLAGLSNIGLDVNEGVTAMRGLLTAIVAPGSMAANALEDLGISTEQLRTVLADEGILGALQLLEDRTGGNIDQLRVIIPNVRSLTGELGLMGENAEQVAAIFGNVKDSAGDADEAFRIWQESSGAKMEQLFADLQVAAIRLGEALLPIAQLLGSTFGTLLDVASPVLQFMDELVIAFLAVQAVMVVMPALLFRVATGFEAIGLAAAATRMTQLSVGFASVAATIGGPLIAAVTLLGIVFFEMRQQAEAAAALLQADFSSGKVGEDLVGLATKFDDAAASAAFMGQVLEHQLGPKLDQAGLDVDTTSFALQSVDAALRSGSVTIEEAAHTFEALGLSADEAEDRTNRFAVKSQEHFDDTGKAVKNFAGLTNEALEEYQADLRETLTVTDDVLGRLAEKSKVTADQMIKSLQKQIKAQRDYNENFQELVDRNLPDDILQQLLDMGIEGASVVQGLANGSKKEMEKFIDVMRASARETEKPIDALNRLNGAIEALPTHKQVQIDVQVNAVAGQISGFSGPIQDAIINALRRKAAEEVG